MLDDPNREKQRQEFIHLLRSAADYNALLKALAKLSGEDLKQAVTELDQQQFVKMGVWTSKTCRALNVQNTLVIGGFMHLYSVAVSVKECSELYENMLDDIGCSKTQAYRCRDAWLHFGKLLIEEPSIRDQFVAESLKLLAEPKASEAARIEAVERARNGERINIRVVKAILAKKSTSHGADQGYVDEQKRANSNATTNSRTGSSSWTFVGHVSKVTVKLASNADIDDKSALIKDLEGAINALAQEVYSTAQ